jgi:hypothetical protein
MTNTEHAAALRINRKLDSLTSAARKAYGSYSIAKGRRSGRIQSQTESRAYYRYQEKERMLGTFCRENGLNCPKTW